MSRNVPLIMIVPVGLVELKVASAVDIPPIIKPMRLLEFLFQSTENFLYIFHS